MIYGYYFGTEGKVDHRDQLLMGTGKYERLTNSVPVDAFEAGSGGDHAGQKLVLRQFAYPNDSNREIVMGVTVDKCILSHTDLGCKSKVTEKYAPPCRLLCPHCVMIV